MWLQPVLLRQDGGMCLQHKELSNRRLFPGLLQVTWPHLSPQDVLCFLFFIVENLLLNVWMKTAHIWLNDQKKRSLLKV